MEYLNEEQKARMQQNNEEIVQEHPEKAPEQPSPRMGEALQEMVRIKKVLTPTPYSVVSNALKGITGKSTTEMLIDNGLKDALIRKRGNMALNYLGNRIVGSNPNVGLGNITPQKKVGNYIGKLLITSVLGVFIYRTLKGK